MSYDDTVALMFARCVFLFNICINCDLINIMLSTKILGIF